MLFWIIVLSIIFATKCFYFTGMKENLPLNKGTQIRFFVAAEWYITWLQNQKNNNIKRKSNEGEKSGEMMKGCFRIRQH